MEIRHLNISIAVDSGHVLTPDDSYNEIEHKKVEIYETWMSEEKFREICKKFKRGHFWKDLCAWAL